MLWLSQIGETPWRFTLLLKNRMGNLELVSRGITVAVWTECETLILLLRVEGWFSFFFFLFLYGEERVCTCGDIVFAVACACVWRKIRGMMV